MNKDFERCCSFLADMIIKYAPVTITPYGRDIEPDVPDKEKVMDYFKKLSDIVGVDSMGWRYDPILDSHTVSSSNVVSSVRNLQGVPFTAVPSMKLLSGIAEMPLIKESITVQTVSQCMSLYWRMHFLRRL